MARLLVVDDEDKYLELCRRFMPEHELLGPVRSYREAIATLRAPGAGVDLVLLDIHFEIPESDLLPEDKSSLPAGAPRIAAVERLQRTQGLHILDRLRQTHPGLPVILMTSRDDLPLEADAERLNAEDYTYLLDDDYLDARSLRLQIEGIIARTPRAAAEEDSSFFWGATPRMEALRRRLGILARGRLPIILQGETGTGKSLVARDYIHARSGRRGAFVAVDLSTIPTELMAAHLFGVVKGAYTGAAVTRDGVVGKADGGTLFLDEIGNLGLELQKQLLLVLQEGRYRPVGSVEERSADVKVVVATNEELPRAVREGRFREDLFMRLNPATALTLPSVRERADDFDDLLQFFLRRVVREAYNRDLLVQYAKQRRLVALASGDAVLVAAGRKVPRHQDPGRIFFLLHPSSYKLLREFGWPGNFRQFEMVLSNLVALTLVELVDRADRVEPDAKGAAARPDVIPIQPRVVRDLLRPMEAPRGGGRDAVRGVDALRVEVVLQPSDSLNAVGCDVERQYLEQLYRRFGGDLGKIAEVLLRDERGGRKVQLRMNQLGIKLRTLKRSGEGSP